MSGSIQSELWNTDLSQKKNVSHPERVFLKKKKIYKFLFFFFFFYYEHFEFSIMWRVWILLPRAMRFVGRKKSSQNTPLYINAINFYTIRTPLSFLSPLENMLMEGVHPGDVKIGPFQTTQTVVKFLLKTEAYFFSLRFSLKRLSFWLYSLHSPASQGHFLQHFTLVVISSPSVSGRRRDSWK